MPSRVLSEIAARRVVFGQPSVEKRAGAWVIRNRGAAYVVRREQEGRTISSTSTTTPRPPPRCAPRPATPYRPSRSKARSARRARCTGRSPPGSRCATCSAATTSRSDFVAEMEYERRGARCASATTSSAGARARARLHRAYRVGNGAAGNVGAEALRHIVPATRGARDRACATRCRRAAASSPKRSRRCGQRRPHAFRAQERAVTPEATTRRSPSATRSVQRAAATLPLDRQLAHGLRHRRPARAARDVDDAFERELRALLERYRMAGHDLEIDAPRFVPLEIELSVCVRPDYFRGDVRRALLRALQQPRAARTAGAGVFHPDNFTFGQTGLPQPALRRRASGGRRRVGAASRRFQRQDEPATTALERRRAHARPRSRSRGSTTTRNLPEARRLRA